jgi:predicted component of type VI protein secretion system
VLVTFSWNSRGELFPLYEGKNVIGSGGASERPQCDVQITTDPTLSREHALIRCLRQDYEIFDQKSQNGTYMNDLSVPVNGVTLQDRSTLRTGQTVWQFLMIRAPERQEKPAPRSDTAPAERDQPATRGVKRGTVVSTEDSPATAAEDVDESVEPPVPRDRQSEAKPPVSDQPEEPPKRRRDKTAFPGSEEPPPGPPKGRPTRFE